MEARLDEKRLDQNIELWSKTHPKEGVLLPYLDPKPLSFKETQDEAKSWFSGLDLSHIEVLYVYGVGQGNAYFAAKSWLQESPKRHLVFLEDNPSVLYHLFQAEVATQMLQDPKVQIHLFKDLKDNEAILEVTYWDFLTTQVGVVAFPYYAKKTPKKVIELEHKILFDTATKNALVEEYLKYGAGFFKNFYPNMRLLHQSLWGNALFGEFKGIPAIICGAGPSLAKSFPLLKDLNKHALIFAGGSAVNALSDAGIAPHFGAGIDPNQEQYKRFSQAIGFEVPFFYRNRMCHDAFKVIKGEKLYISGSGGYDIADWFDEQLGLSAEPLDEGHNVVNFCTEIAYQMGCSPIIFVGLDLAYTGMELYAPGVVGDSRVTAEELLSVSELDDRAIIRPDIEGNPVYTHWKWIAEAEWIKEFGEEHPLTPLINATEGGMGIPSVPNIPLKEVVATHLQKTFPLNQLVQASLKKGKIPQVTQSVVEELFETLRLSLQRSIEHLTILIEEAERLIELKNASAHQSGLAALAETELSEEDAYKAVLDVFNAVISRALSSEMGLAHKLAKPLDQFVAKQQIHLKKFRFLRDVAAANLELMEVGL